MTTVAVNGVRLEVARLAPTRVREGAPTIVFLHEALGSVSMWRDFPQLVADATDCRTVAYSRAGHGSSDPARLPRTTRYLHDEGEDVLPALLAALGLERPVLFGHSDGASIALIAASVPATALAGIVVEAPHVIIEEVTLAGVRRAVRGASSIERRLARHHSEANARTVFRAWSDIWLDPALRTWSIEELLGRITCPVLAIQGDEDEYGTMAQLDRIAELAGDVTQLRLPGCGHQPHRDRAQAVLEAVAAFVERVSGSANR